MFQAEGPEFSLGRIHIGWATEKNLAEKYLGKSQHTGQNHGLKSHRRPISGASEVSTTEPAQRQPEAFGRPKRCALQNAGLKRVILTILGCVLGVLGLILDPGGP